MKLITLFVGNRLDHVINFDTRGKQVPETYIIKREEVTDLFAFYHSIGEVAFTKKKKQQDNNSAIVYQNNDGESTLHIKSINAKASSACCIDITVEFSSEEPKDRIKLGGLEECGLNFDTDDPSLWVMMLESETIAPVMVNISFILTIGPRDYEQKLQLCVAEDNKISDIVLDFGSEASQTGIFKRGTPQDRTDIRELFTEMEKLLSPASVPAYTGKPSMTPQSNSDNYVQQDRNKNFFKSVFFAKQRFTDEDAGDPIPKLDSSGEHVKESPVIRMLTSQMEAQNLVKNQGYIEIPNVKITQFGGVKQPKIGPDNDPILDYKDGYFYRISINHFILNALKKAKTPCVSLYILMPNVYSQLSVFHHLRWIREDIQKILEENVSLSEKIKAVELSAISESDASLLGAIRVIEDNNTRNDSVDAGQYIIIDAGKGTLDYSAIRYETNPETKLYSIYRSGIIGAGNALTYAYFFALMKEYMTAVVTSTPSEDDLLSFVYENVLGCTPEGITKGGGDLANLIKLMQAVERYKIAIGTEGSRPSVSINPLTNKAKASSWKDVEMSSLTTFINNMVPNSRSYKPLSQEAEYYVVGTINQLVDEVCKSLSILKSLEYGKADGVIFAGRGFALPAFKKAMRQKLEEKGIADDELTYMRSDIEVDQKSVCLYIRTAIQKRQYNNHMTSTPIVLRKVLSKGSAEKKDFWTWLQELLGFGSKKAENSVVQKAGDFLIGIIDNREGAYHTPGSTETNGMVSGFSLSVVNGDSLMIGGTKYSIPEISGDVTIFFSGDKIYCRYMDDRGRMRVTELAEDGVNLKNSPFLFQTLFPNVDNVDCIKLPFNPLAEQERQEEEKLHKKNKKIKFTGDNNDNSEDNNANADTIETAEEADDSNSDAGDGSATSKARDLANKF